MWPNDFDNLNQYIKQYKTFHFPQDTTGFVWHSCYIFTIFTQYSSLVFSSTDHAEFSAQIRAKDTHCEGWRHPEDDQQPVFLWNTVHRRHCLPEWRGQLSAVLTLHDNLCLRKVLIEMLTAVSSSPQITALKIKHNPFAKAFLDAKERYDVKPQMNADITYLVHWWYRI